MELEKYFDLDVNPNLLYGDASKVIKGIHGISINNYGEHFATAFHIYSGKGKVIAKTGIRNFLLNKFPGSGDLTNEYKKCFAIEEEVQYEGGVLLKKIKLEWIAEMFEIETAVNVVSTKSFDVPLAKLNIEYEIVPLLNRLSTSIVFNSEEKNSHHHLFQDIFQLIQNNPDKYEVLSLVYFPMFFEKTCDYLFKNSAEFKAMINNYFTIKENKENKGAIFKINSGSSKTYTITNYVNFIKTSKIVQEKINNINVEIKKFIFFDNPSLTKTFNDIYYFISLRNNLIHNEFNREDSIYILSASKTMLKFNVDIIEEYL
jgi:hypothetical protein